MAGAATDRTEGPESTEHFSKHGPRPHPRSAKSVLGVGKEPSGKRTHTGVREALAEQEAVCLPWGELGLDMGQGRPP